MVQRTPVGPGGSVRWSGVCSFAWVDQLGADHEVEREGGVVRGKHKLCDSDTLGKFSI